MMPFGLTNAPNTFMRLMNHVLRDCIGKFVVVYFDDILVYNKSLHEHIGYLKVILSTLRDNHPFENKEKCTFFEYSVIFLGFIVNKHGVHVDPTKFQAIQDWPTLQNVEVKSFHGITSFYRRFVFNFSSITSPLNELVKKDVKFEWGKRQELVFKQLKDKLTNAPILVLQNFTMTFEIECDAGGVGYEEFCYKRDTPLLISVKNSMVPLLTTLPMIKSCML